MHAGRLLKTRALWAFRNISRIKEREIKKGSVGGREGRRREEYKDTGERAEGRTGRQKDKDKFHTYPWLMALCI